MFHHGDSWHEASAEAFHQRLAKFMVFIRSVQGKVSQREPLKSKVDVELFKVFEAAMICDFVII